MYDQAGACVRTNAAVGCIVPKLIRRMRKATLVGDIVEVVMFDKARFDLFDICEWYFIFLFVFLLSF